MLLYFQRIASGAWSLCQGLWTTMRIGAFRKPVTAEYPHEQPELSPAYRSCIQLIRFDETDTHDCVACMQCVQVCPSDCITIEGERPDGMKKKRATQFDVHYSLCSLCGLCLDVCPTDTLEYSNKFDDAGYHRDEWTYDLLAPYRDGEEAYREVARAEQAKKDAEKAALKAAKEAAAAKKAAEQPQDAKGDS
jgi:NADH-quinone oxidoreductase subunit I